MFADKIKDAIINKQRENFEDQIVEWKRRKHLIESLDEFDILYKPKEIDKIKTFGEKNGFATNEVEELLYNEPAWFGVILKIDAVKQNIPEQMQIANYKLTKNYMVNTTNHKESENCIATINNKTKIYKQTQLNNIKGMKTTASIDFEYVLNMVTTYVFFKYTSNDGGSQKQTKGEAVTFIEFINKLGKEFVANWELVLDGSYWTPKIYDELNSLVEHGNITITNSDCLNTKLVNNYENQNIVF